MRWQRLDHEPARGGGGPVENVSRLALGACLDQLAGLRLGLRPLERWIVSITRTVAPCQLEQPTRTGS